MLTNDLLDPPAKLPEQRLPERILLDQNLLFHSALLEYVLREGFRGLVDNLLFDCAGVDAHHLHCNRLNFIIFFRFGF